VNDVRKLIGITYPAANELVGRIEALGIIEEITGQTRNRRYRYGPYIRLFNEE
jgi:DNA-binding MarR family transcriptional regulator